VSLSAPAEIAAFFCQSLDAATRYDAPFPHIYADHLFPDSIVAALADLPFASGGTCAASGQREDEVSRIFFGAAEMDRFPVMRSVAEALQAPEVIRRVGAFCAAPLRGCHLRLEYAIDTDDFWLMPHTDIGVKKFTCLISLADYKFQADLGTDIYNSDNRLYKRAPFRRNGALMFVPGPESWHGFAPRLINGRRKSIILNYVGPGWRARDQLAFPDAPVGLDG
jgi:hypothetical protein